MQNALEKFRLQEMISRNQHPGIFARTVATTIIDAPVETYKMLKDQFNDNPQAIERMFGKEAAFIISKYL